MTKQFLISRLNYMLGLINNIRYDRLDKSRQYSFKTDLENYNTQN